MKIGTDGVLLGAWVSIKNNPFSILDIGAGTGIIALQLAQRSNAEMVDAIEIDENAYEQCVDNFENSPWGDRLFCYHASLEEFVEEIEEKYDIIISNPPFYSPPLPSASPTKGEKIISTSRELARFNDALPFDELIESASQLLSDEGIFAVIIPRKEEENFIAMASEVNLFPNRICRVRGTETSEEKRSMLEFSFEKISPKIENLTIETSRHIYTEEYQNLVQDFYLKM
ncbi:tRNA (adenine-N(6)-)-methyltransferase [Aequorivita soesokkakensis]|uniref:tRNA1(Val) (adenine(37)-N6)-methyltransferase n=2 Tax=Aequorivita soesokkakensis TaxID=1385699 RepID=A0A1A9LG42_9FLAO|nr:tRNA (adenine-N(6)-)-methyltransferase [Aequorivita soesokkakensis]